MTDQAAIDVLADDEIIRVARKLKQAREAKADWEKVEKAARKELLDALADGTRAVDANGNEIVLLTKSERRGIDSKKLRALWPDIAEELETVTEVTTVNVSGYL